MKKSHRTIASVWMIIVCTMYKTDPVSACISNSNYQDCALERPQTIYEKIYFGWLYSSLETKVSIVIGAVVIIYLIFLLASITIYKKHRRNK